MINETEEDIGTDNFFRFGDPRKEPDFSKEYRDPEDEPAEPLLPQGYHIEEHN